MAEVLLRIENLDKSFFGVPVLRDVGFELKRGHVLGLVGENGSGKSTTMNILGGIHRRDGGRIELEGRDYAPESSREAQARGIAFIHQELSLFPNLSIEENIFLDHFPRLGGLPFIDRRRMRERARAALDLVDLKVAPGTPVSRLPQGERQLVEIVKALSREAKLIIFDEPTTSLTARESERLFGIIERLRGQGLSVIYISHILGDVLRLCDDIVVLRDGQVMAAEPRAAFAVERMITLMVGRTIDHLFPERTTEPDRSRAALAVRGLSQPGVVKDIAFDLHPGEVLGVSGLMGAGRSELARILFGLDGYAAGEILVHGRRLPPRSPRQAMEQGLAFLTEDRRGEGLMMEASIRDNIVLPSLPDHAGPFLRLLNPAELGEMAQTMAERVKVNARTLDRTAVRTLSGGNQQKVVIAKWLLRRPSVFILDEPTRGIDVGAKYEVYKIINQLVGEGAAVLLISSEIEELIGMTDRIMVMARGEVRGFYDRAQYRRETLLRAALWD
ncbi:sugar ABC transporter ATP-binding protein [Labrys wisconsinensis]|uniref:ABC-type sugar transport system ATPase subunit n=1 Tax=Labrys wisconsinensis TaxID=425677 RepID=A0ABU0J515_9HYPH|nr:sugar ABC transporter ATP-binding protein [Labrys wisconsinensis]MDQ0469358.1 ABC-type sugar transport system ATPase subunit [Labrys wisconsinensis]